LKTRYFDFSSRFFDLAFFFGEIAHYLSAILFSVRFAAMIWAFLGNRGNITRSLMGDWPIFSAGKPYAHKPISEI
jgi:hypothetical protein